MIQFECPHCREPLNVPEARADTEAVCPRCRKPVRIPPIVSNANGAADMPSAPPVIQKTEPEIAETAVVNDSTEPSGGDMDVPNESSGTQGHEGGEEASPQGTNEELIDSGVKRVEVSNKHFNDLEAQVNRGQQANNHTDKIHRHTRDHALVGVSRATIYGFVALIGFVSLTSFWIGMMIGPAEESTIELQGFGMGLVPCEGRVTYRTSDDPEALDAQALVFFYRKAHCQAKSFQLLILYLGMMYRTL